MSKCHDPLVVHLPELLPVVLVHGGLYDEPAMTGQSFWIDSGVASMLRGRNVEVIIHQRPVEPTSWVEEAEALASTIEKSGHDRVAIVAGSNGCSAALRLLLDRPELVARTMLCWPATAGDPVIDQLARIIIADAQGEEAADRLLEGWPIRGTTSEELETLGGEHGSDIVLYPSMPENQAHRRSTQTELLTTIPGIIMVGGGPEPFDDSFADFVDAYVNLVEAFSRAHHDD